MLWSLTIIGWKQWVWLVFMQMIKFIFTFLCAAWYDTLHRVINFSFLHLVLLLYQLAIGCNQQYWISRRVFLDQGHGYLMGLLFTFSSDFADVHFGQPRSLNCTLMMSNLWSEPKKVEIPIKKKNDWANNDQNPCPAFWILLMISTKIVFHSPAM